MSKILLMKMVNRDGLEETTAHKDSKDLVGFLWGKRLDDISWIIKLDGMLIQKSDFPGMWPQRMAFQGMWPPKMAEAIDAFGREEESEKK